jgi:hypothetical protein
MTTATAERAAPLDSLDTAREVEAARATLRSTEEARDREAETVTAREARIRELARAEGGDDPATAGEAAGSRFDEERELAKDRARLAALERTAAKARDALAGARIKAAVRLWKERAPEVEGLGVELREAVAEAVAALDHLETLAAFHKRLRDTAKNLHLRVFPEDPKSPDLPEVPDLLELSDPDWREALRALRSLHETLNEDEKA